MGTTPILALAFLQSLSSTCLQRGVFFLTTSRLQFGDVANLALAAGLGAAYVLGARMSPIAAARLGERRMLGLILVANAATAVFMGLFPAPLAVAAGTLAYAFVDGAKWPVMESYVGAGHDVAGALRAVGRFNLAWSTAAPLGLAVSGPVIQWWAPGLFVLAAALQLVSGPFLARLARCPQRLADDHPSRPDDSHLRAWAPLLRANRWLMVLSYMALFVVSPLIPGILRDLRLDLATASGLAALIDVARVGAFIALGRWRGWHGKRWPAAVAVFTLPAAFFLVMVGRGSLAAVLGGEVLFGLSMGIVYYGSLYYALVIRNAAVEAGGTHEALIGAAFALGPLTALIGRAFTGILGDPMAATLATLAPVFLLASTGALLTLIRSHIGNRRA